MTVEVRLNVVVHRRSSLMGCVGGGVGPSSDPKCLGRLVYCYWTVHCLVGDCGIVVARVVGWGGGVVMCRFLVEFERTKILGRLQNPSHRPRKPIEEIHVDNSRHGTVNHERQTMQSLQCDQTNSGY